jgi:hypothetical protein
MKDDKGRLLKALQKIRQEYARAAERQQTNDKRGRDDNRFVFSFRRKIDVNSNPYRYTSQQRGQDQTNKLDADMVLWTRAVAKYTKWLVIVGTVGAAVALGTLWAIKGQWDQMRAEQRAWVSFEPNIKLTQGIEYGVHGAEWTINYPIHNTGHTPAAYVWVDTLLTSGMTNETARRVAFINDEKHIPPVFDSGRYLFPGDRGDFAFQLAIGKDELAQIEQSNLKFLRPIITACIRYYFMMETIPHLTCVTTEMFTKRGLIPANNTPVAIDDIVFRYFMFGPSFAN